MKLHRFSAALYASLILLLVFSATPAQGPGQGGKRQGVPRQPQGEQNAFQPAIQTPAHAIDVILGRPTDSSIVLSVLSAGDANAEVAYGTSQNDLHLQTLATRIEKGQPREILIDHLNPGTRYYYQLRDVATKAPLAQGSFQTRRPPGSTFTFTVTADSHLDSNTNLALYQRTLDNAAADAPDFHIDLGDTFMSEKHLNRANATTQYIAQRYFLGKIAASAPLFLAIGNHDGEAPRGHGSDPRSLAVWSNTMRTRYFPNPVPGGIYTGNSARDPEAGLLEDYYAWQWGDALFIVLDPYWYSTANRSDNNWGLSLGIDQYKWLKQTLESSDARFKFVFIHQLVGGFDSQGRGGVEAAGFGEWGGKNHDGSDGLKEHRPGWDLPIHALLVRNHVTMVFHGHDHLFAAQSLDGIAYQEVPQPGDPRPGPPPSAADYGYTSGTILGSSGHMRISVSPSQVRAEYVRSALPADERGGIANRQVAYAYTIDANGSIAISPQRAADPQPRPRQGNRGNQQSGAGRNPRRDLDESQLPADIADLQRLSIVLGRPTDRSVTANILSAASDEGYIEYGQSSGVYTLKTSTVRLDPGNPAELLLDQLAPDKQYFYRLRYRSAGNAEFTAAPERSFHTQRAAGSSFVFEIQGDSHPERPQQFDPALYAQTLRAAAADHPDFYMTIGDDFSVDTLRTVNADTVAQRYKLQRPFLAIVGQSAPVFLVNGNHEQAAAANLDGTPNNVAVWAGTARNKYYSEPLPDGFYTGDSTPVPSIGLVHDYYSWTWGDALFVVIDPYWHSPTPVDNVFGGGEKTRDLWDVTLGEEQYRWFRQTLASSKAKYKFVFAHHVLGTGRGGIEEAGQYEWGGKDKRGVDGFSQHRPGWEAPIQQLMARYGVTIFFQGHDHVFAHQQLDGVTYQALAEPADSTYTLYNRDAYQSGEVIANSGRVRVTISPSRVHVEYLRSWLPKDATATHPDGEIASAYDIVPSQRNKTR
jgi:phosphodiesterase/alkaline phosphatase D-like protein